jgi:bifunctional isochorismate lyase/aryl carrier protein
MPTYDDKVLSQIAEMLDVPVSELDRKENLMDAGMDSIRVMTLVEQWRANGVDVDFTELIETPTLDHWLHTLGTTAKER